MIRLSNPRWFPMKPSFSFRLSSSYFLSILFLSSFCILQPIQSIKNPPFNITIRSIWVLFHQRLVGNLNNFLVWLSAVSDCLQATSYLFFAGLKCVFHTNEPITVSSTSSLTTCDIFLSYLPLRSLCVFATIIIHLWPYWPAGSDPMLSVSVSLLSLYGLFRAWSLRLHLLFQPVAKYSVEENEESSINMSLIEKKRL